MRRQVAEAVLMGEEGRTSSIGCWAAFESLENRFLANESAEAKLAKDKGDRASVSRQRERGVVD